LKKVEKTWKFATEVCRRYGAKCGFVLAVPWHSAILMAYLTVAPGFHAPIVQDGGAGRFVVVPVTIAIGLFLFNLCLNGMQAACFQ
jgi:hypothetical protein